MKKQDTIIEQLNVETSMLSKVFDCSIALLAVPKILVSLNFPLLSYAAVLLYFVEDAI